MIRDRDPYEDHDPFRLHVFVPAIMSAGLLFSLLTLARDALAGRSRRGERRRAAVAASAVVADVLRAERSPSDMGLRPRRFYLLVAIGGVAAAIYLLPGALLNYAHDGGYVSDIAWLLSTSLVSAVVAVAAACVAGATWWRWPAPPPWARRAIAATPLGADPGSEAADGGDGVDPALGAGLVATGGALLALAVGVGASRAAFARADERLLERIVDLDLPAAVERLAGLGDTRVAVVLALLIGAATVRCRAFAASWIAAIAGTFAIDTAIKAVVERPRPSFGSLGPLEDSFPSGHVAQVVLLAMAAPLALRVATGRRWPGAVAGAVLAASAAVTAVERVHVGSHWPTDVIGGALLGLLGGLTVRWSVGHARWHEGCGSCPWRSPSAAAPRRAAVIALTARRAHQLRVTAGAWLAVVVAVLLVAARTGGLPTDPEGDGALAQVEPPAQLVLLGLAVVGGLLAVRWPVVGATVLAVCALGLGLLSSVEHPVWVVAAVTLALAAPAVLLWLAWQHAHSHGAIATLAIVATGLLVGQAVTAQRVFDHFFGPAHPESATAPVPVDLVEWAWSGDLRVDGVTVVVRLADASPHDPVALFVEPDGGVPRVAATGVADPDGIVRLRAAGLAAGTGHRWWVEVDGAADHGRGRGRFTTAPDGAGSFTLAAGSCARTGSDGAVFDAIREADPLLYLATGDLHYSNIAATETGPFLGAYRRVLTSPSQAELFRSVPVDYVWDDHDYGPNDADSTSPGRAAAREAYRQAVPHPPLPSDGAIYHASTVGRVRIVVTDTRSERTEGSMLGAEQLRWLLGELAGADRWGLVVWVNPDPWIAPADPARDDWGGFADERRLIADTIAEAGVDNLVMVAGDAHMVAIDDGTNSDYSTSGGAAFPVLHAAALDRPGNVKGGPYSEGAFPGAGQFGLLHVHDDGTTVTVDLEGRDWTGAVLARHRFVAG